MKNRDENTTIIQFSYRGSTFFETFFKQFKTKVLYMKNALMKRAFLLEFILSEQ
jgi:hypothetical protein